MIVSCSYMWSIETPSSRVLTYNSIATVEVKRGEKINDNNVSTKAYERWFGINWLINHTDRKYNLNLTAFVLKY